MIFSGAKLCIKERGCSFVENDDRRVLHDSPCDGNALALAAAERRAALADDGVETVRQCQDTVSCVLQTMRKRLLTVACAVNSLFVGKPGSDTFALFFEISVF